jgi:hypothetical protein
MGLVRVTLLLASQLILSESLDSTSYSSLKHGELGFAPSFRPSLRGISQGGLSKLHMSGFGKQKEQPRKAPKKAERQASDANNMQHNTQTTLSDGPSTRKVDRPAALEQVT